MNRKTEGVVVLTEDDSPVDVLRIHVDLTLYLVHKAEHHYIIKLIKLEEAKVSTSAKRPMLSAVVMRTVGQWDSTR